LHPKRTGAAVAAVTTIIPTAPAPLAPVPVAAPPPPPAPAPRRGLFGALKTMLFGDAPAANEPGEERKAPARTERKSGRDERHGSGRDRDRDRTRRGRGEGGERKDRDSSRQGRDKDKDRDRKSSGAGGGSGSEPRRAQSPRNAEQRSRRE